MTERTSPAMKGVEEKTQKLKNQFFAGMIHSLRRWPSASRPLSLREAVSAGLPKLPTGGTSISSTRNGKEGG